MVVPRKAVDAGVNHNLIGHGQPFGEALHQQGFIFWGQAMGDCHFNFSGNLGVLPLGVNLD
jgi:hypothetical protein